MRAAWLGWCSGTICGYHCGMFPHIATSPMVRRAGAGALALRGVPPARPRSTLRLDLRVSGRRTAEERSKVQSAAPVDETRRPCMVASCSRWDAARPRRGRDQSLARPCCPGRDVGAGVSSGCEGVLERSAAPWLENGFRRGSRSGTRRHVSNFLLRMGCWHSTRAQHIFWLPCTAREDQIDPCTDRSLHSLGCVCCTKEELFEYNISSKPFHSQFILVCNSVYSLPCISLCRVFSESIKYQLPCNSDY